MTVDWPKALGGIVVACAAVLVGWLVRGACHNEIQEEHAKSHESQAVIRENPAPQPTQIVNITIGSVGPQGTSIVPRVRVEQLDGRNPSPPIHIGSASPIGLEAPALDRPRPDAGPTRPPVTPPATALTARELSCGHMEVDAGGIRSVDTPGVIPKGQHDDCRSSQEMVAQCFGPLVRKAGSRRYLVQLTRQPTELNPSTILLGETGNDSEFRECEECLKLFSAHPCPGHGPDMVLLDWEVVVRGG